MKKLLLFSMFFVFVAHASQSAITSSNRVDRTTSETADIPIEATTRSAGSLTDEEKLYLLLLAKNEYPDRSVEKIILHTWHHPNDLPVATIEFAPQKGNDGVHTFGRLTVLNKNWRHRWREANENDRIYEPKECWHLTERSRRDIIRHEFNYRGETILVDIGPHRPDEITMVLKMFKKGVVHRQRKVADKILTNEIEHEWVAQWNFRAFPIIRIKPKKDKTHVAVSYQTYALGGRIHDFIIENDRLISNGIINWMANNASHPIAASRGEG